ncbi:hypothetical protein E4U24_004573 [Claviceps purpurea]|nr:hypothetical protein E4U50_006884 [Claviceps purpurea]KAG6245171.1 hypothetical protein E4U24_004573 [Claviceps purpurea]
MGIYRNGGNQPIPGFPGVPGCNACPIRPHSKSYTSDVQLSNWGNRDIQVRALPGGATCAKARDSGKRIVTKVIHSSDFYGPLTNQLND